MSITASPQSLTTLLDKTPRHTHVIGLQAPSGNANNILFGDREEQPFELRPEANAMLPVKVFKEVYVKGTPPDKLSIVLFDE